MAVFLRASDPRDFDKIARCRGGKDLKDGLARPSQKGKLRPGERKGLGQGPTHRGRSSVRTQDPGRPGLPAQQQAAVSMLYCALFLPCRAWLRGVGTQRPSLMLPEPSPMGDEAPLPIPLRSVGSRRLLPTD